MPQRKVLLTVTSEDPETEVFIIDGDFQLVERGVGQMRVSLAPGIYNVKLRAGVQTAERLVVLLGDKPEQELNLEAFEFSSAAPLERTAKTHGFHMEAARAHAGVADVTAGRGSWVYVFARDWTSREKPENPGRVHHPMRGLSLYDMDGGRVADLHSGEVSAGEWDPCAGCNVEVEPGSYRLRLELPGGGGTVERIVVASRGWQTQVFLMQTDYGRGPDGREADLSRGSVFLSPSPSFDPAQPSHRQTELARLALASGRHRVSAELRKTLRGPIKDPMFGIYGAHLLLLDPEPDYELLGEVVAELRRMLGAHPDVEAAALKLPGATFDGYSFESPPMLRRSWACVVEATTTRGDLVPDGSLAARISTRLWGDGLWLAWATPPPETLAEAAEVDAELLTAHVIQDALLSQLRHLREAPGSEELTPHQAASALGRALRYLSKILFGGLSGLLGRLLKSQKMSGPETSDGSKAEGGMVAGAQPQKSGEPAAKHDPEGILDDETAAKLVRAFGIPRAQIEKLLGDFEKKL